MFLLLISSSFIPRKSTQKEVVKEVSALSALLYAAAINPNKKLTPKINPSSLFNAISGNNKSVLIDPSISGIEIEF